MNEMDLDFDFLILNRIPGLYSARRFISEIQRLNLRGKLASPEWLADHMSQIETRTSEPRSSPAILYRQGDFNFWATHKMLLHSKLRIINSPKAFINARDKFCTYQNWLRNEIPTPRTAVLTEIAYAGGISENLSLPDLSQIIFKNAAAEFGLPFMLKKRFSSQGRGVFLISSTEQLEKILAEDLKFFSSATDIEIDYFKNEYISKTANAAPSQWLQLQRWLAQACIQESLGKDIRSFHIGNDHYPVARVNENSHVSNLHQGGEAFLDTLSEEEKTLCYKVHSVSGLKYSGIDFLRTSQGPIFLEANPSPGFEGIEKIYPVNIAEKLIRLLVATDART
jgi:glutathione synthase/RimK-type ligase-like ATP-grasp enzyme